ncbi:hypothetical protein BB560_001468 [Smittium megazygosporum]|uniref:Serine/threonine-protein phosphatase 2A activator n=1 Tax=Smittium megazygosporum TaxID=133381 RepID=A0A2T9ZHH3_9FUNG|nr:hypothetical protein BB560_001468 [Smittium megazygosporum]
MSGIETLEAKIPKNTPIRKILTKEDLEAFRKTPIFKDLFNFICLLNSSVKGCKTSQTDAKSEIIGKLEAILDNLLNLVKETPPLETNSRFGNPAFRQYFDKAEEEIHNSLAQIIDTDHLTEVVKYFSEGLGSRKRIDYGTGHELNFIVFLFCLYKLNKFADSDYKNLVLVIFYKYIALLRKLQTTYWLEPAGSHGVWGLDDYHYLPFMFGSSQLALHKHLKPKSIHNPEVLEEYSKEYMYLDMIYHVDSLKTGSIQWHSPMIDDISGAKSWQKVNDGLIKMYSAEVLNKLPIMQHFLFGTIITFESGSLPRDLAIEIETASGDTDGCKGGHIYALGQEFPVCCGIRIPSVFAAPTYQGYEKEGLLSSIPYQSGKDDPKSTANLDMPRQTPRMYINVY